MKSYFYGCPILGHRSEEFRRVLFETGVEICDSCPFAECKADQVQAQQMISIERAYKKAHMTELEKMVLAKEKEEIQLKWKEQSS